MAKLKDNIKIATAIINDSVIFTISKDQTFFYEDYAHNAMIPDGRSAYIAPEKIQRIDSPYFKFNFSKWNFVVDKDYELLDAAKTQGIT